MNLTSCEKFLDYVAVAMETNEMPDEAVSFYESIKTQYEVEKNKPPFTENGLLILEFLQNEPSKSWTSKDMGEAMDLPARTISGAIRKLVTDGYVAKNENDKPVTYKITDKGINCNVNDYKENEE